MLQNLTLSKKLWILLIIPFITLFCTVYIYTMTTNKISYDLQSILYNQGLKSLDLVLNADRDYYQSLSAMQEYIVEHNNDKRKDMFDTYESNMKQVEERIGKAKDILEKNHSVWEQYKQENKSVFDNFDEFKTDFNNWKDKSNKVIKGEGDFKSQSESFDVAREHINTITEILEKGAEKEALKIDNNKAITLNWIMFFNFCIFISVFLLAMFVFKSIIAPIKNLTKISNQLAENNLNVLISNDNSDTEMGELNRSFNKFISNFKKLITQVSNTVGDVTSCSEKMMLSAEQTSLGSQKVSTSAQKLAIGTQNQANSVNISLENINLINNKVNKVLESSVSTLKMSKLAEDNVNNGRKQSDIAVSKIYKIKETTWQVSTTINNLGVLSSEIEVIVDLIKSIAGQTNLLALNAAIEAARAGEQGKGFAVVAEEVKKLAGQSADATDKITEMVKEIQNSANNAVEVMEKGATEVAEGVESIGNVSNVLNQILSAVKETAINVGSINSEISGLVQNSEDITKTMENVYLITDKSAVNAEEIAAITEEQTANLHEINTNLQSFAQITDNLKKQIAIFKI
ncbi:MAG: HAMP domain-containing methyl-accepting chemotaxis protein [bacterium]